MDKLGITELTKGKHVLFHPSGDPTPSMEDIEVTKRLAEAGKIIGIEVLDHLIVSHTGKYVSLKERGIFNKKKDKQEGDGSPFCFIGTGYLWKSTEGNNQ
ncbi:JAB domain-containing protein [Peribacillus frigoritolerans]|uniref:JAB domain-containing protein n=1 Tax=Peribacillus frigoritolerans TaxID=450367 RepID=UPI003B8D2905